MSDDADPPGHVFLSYFSADSAAADTIQAALQSGGLRVWRDTADRWPGEDWRHQIRQAISHGALAFVACFSRASLAQPAGRHYEELTQAIDQFRQVRPGAPWLIPVRLDDCAVPDLDIGAGRTLTSLQPADLFGPGRENALARLVTALQRLLGANPAAPAAPQPQVPAAAPPGAPPAGSPAVSGQNVRISATGGGVAAGVIYGNVVIRPASSEPAKSEPGESPA